MIEILRVLFLLLLLTTCSAIDLHVSPVRQACGASCSGGKSQPFGNFFDALKASQSYSEDVTINFLHDTTNPHYLLLKEIEASSNSVLYDYQDLFWNFTIGNLTIKPVFCDESATSCIERNETLKVYLKTSLFSLLLKGRVVIQNIVFDGVEDIQIWNNGSDIDHCLFTRSDCCSSAGNSGPVSCAPTSKEFDSNKNNNSSLLILAPPSQSNSSAIEIVSSKFTNLICPHLNGVIQTGSSNSSINLTDVSLNRIFFAKGFILTNNSTTTAMINIERVSLQNYNPLNLYDSRTKRNEGYLIYFPGIFSGGTLKIINSTFSNTTVSTRDKCWPQTLQYYKSPMMYFTDPSKTFSRSDIWNQYDQDHKNKYLTSSLIHIGTLSAGTTISIQDSQFQNIIGTSGSVLRISDVSTSKTWISIHRCNFDGNIAHDGFANILIAKISNPSFARMLSCPHVEIVGSNFSNTYGCPGSYGNVALICYFDSAPPLTTTSLNRFRYDLATFDINDYSGPNPNNRNSLLGFFQETSEQYAYIRIVNSTFINNQLAISNSLAIAGSYFTVLEGNTFQGNGGTSMEIAKLRLKGSYFASRHSNAGYFPPPATGLYFGQSTAVYFDRLIRLNSRRNQFNSNWGPWDGSLSLGSSLTIKNRIQVLNLLNFKDDIFQNHHGVSENIFKDLPPDRPNDRIYMPPIVTISIDNTGSQLMISALAAILVSSKLGTFIEMNGVIFNNNNAIYDLDNYTPMDQRAVYLQKQTMASEIALYQLGFIKFTASFETLDSNEFNFLVENNYRGDIPASFLFRNGKVSNNKLLSYGCLFPTLIMESYLIDNVTIINNEIATNSPSYNEKEGYLPATFLPDEMAGIFCLYYADSLTFVAYIQLVANNLFAKNNTGTLFYLPDDPIGATYVTLTNSVFLQNQCNYASLIVGLKFLTVLSINNTFIENNNAFGIAAFHPFAQYVGSINRYIGNDGIHASIVLVHGAMYAESFECGSRAYNNTVSPREKVSMGLMAQGSLYYALLSPFIFVDVDFRLNRAYSGIITSYGSSMKFYACRITENQVFGISILGTLVVASKFTIVDSEISNNLLVIDNGISFSSKAIISLHNIQLEMTNFRFEGNIIQGQGFLIFCNTVGASFQNVSILNTHQIQQREQSSLFVFILSQVDMKSLKCSNITSLLTLTQTSINVDSANIEDLHSQNNIQFLVSLYNSSFTAKNFNYSNGLDTISGSQFPLLDGSHATISFDKSYFYEPGRKYGTIFSLSNDGLLSLMRSIFSFAEEADVLVIKAESIQAINAQNCIFQSFGTLLDADDLKLGLLFVSNTIFNTGNSLVLQNTVNIYLIDNYLIPGVSSMSVSQLTPISESSIQIVDSSGQNFIQKNVFCLQTSLNGVIQVVNENSAYKIDFTENQFIGNAASKGGALYLSTIQTEEGDTPSLAVIASNTFLGNKAMRGGAVYLTSPNQIPQETRISNCLFVNNSAEQRGGAIYFDFSPPTFVGNKSIFERNIAGESQENHIGSYPVRLIQVTDQIPQSFLYTPSNESTLFVQQSEKYHWFNLSSGSNAPDGYVFMLLDMFNQTVFDDSSSFLELYPLNMTEQARTAFSNKLSVQAKGGLYNLNNFVFTYHPNSDLNISLKSTAISEFSSQSPAKNLAILPSVETQAHFRPCYSYEVQVKDNNFLVTCQPCQAGFWQVSPPDAQPTCTECNQESTYCFGGPQVGPKEGYWRMNETADLVLECPRREACKGNLVITESDRQKLDPVGSCAYGYQGHLCNQCIEGWAKTINEECVSCEANASYYLRLFGMMAFQAFLILNSLRGAFQFGSKYNKRDQMKINSAVLSRILTNYLQLLSLVGSFPVNWANFLKNILSTSSSLSSMNEQLFAMDCTFIFLRLDRIQSNMMTLKTAIVSLLPSFLIILGISLLFIYYICRRKSIFNREFASRAITIIVVVCFNMQLNAVKRNFFFLQCRNLYRMDTPQRFSTQDYELECWQGDHLSWTLTLILPSLVVWGVLLPAIMFYVLTINRHKLDKIGIANKFAFLYAGYKNEKYFWEFAIMIRKFALLMLFAFNDPNSIYLQIYFSIIVIVVSYILQILFCPYSDKKLNHLERIGLFSSAMLGICSLYFTNTDRDLKMDIFMVSLSLAGIAWFIIKFGILFIKNSIYLLQRNSKLQAFLGLFRKHLGFCFQQKKNKQIIGSSDLDIELVKPQTTRSIVTSQETPRLLLTTDFSQSPTRKSQKLIGRSSTFHLNHKLEKKEDFEETETKKNFVSDAMKSKSVPKAHFHKGFFFQEKLDEEEEIEEEKVDVEKPEIKSEEEENNKLEELFKMISEEKNEKTLLSLQFEEEDSDIVPKDEEEGLQINETPKKQASSIPQFPKLLASSSIKKIT